MPSRKSTTALAYLAVLLISAALSARAEVKLHGLFSDNMVLQQGISAPVWGWADDGEIVTVEFRSQKVKTTAKNGKWLVHLKKLKAGGPDMLTVAGRNTIALKNILVGEVWIASGQSNMEWPLRLSYNVERDIAATPNPMKLNPTSQTARHLQARTSTRS